MADVTLQIDDFEDLIEDAVEESMAIASEFARGGILNQIPSNRRKTRKHLILMHNGLSGQVGIRFPPGSRYQKRGTETERLMKKAWRNTEQATFDVTEKAITTSVEEME